MSSYQMDESPLPITNKSNIESKKPNKTTPKVDDEEVKMLKREALQQKKLLRQKRLNYKKNHQVEEDQELNMIMI